MAKSRSQRILALYFPHLATDRIARSRWGMSWRCTGRPDGPPLVCAASIKNAMRLTALDEVAERIGLKKLQGVAEARAIHPKLEVIMADAAADRRFLAAIADWCDRYTPLVALDGEDGIFLDITGCAHLFGGEAALLKDVLSKLQQFGLDVRATISSSPGLSWAIARYGQETIIGDGEAERALAPLPLSALRLDEQMVLSLFKVGLRQVGDLFHKPRAPLARRFGAGLLLRLDQALGQDDEPISPRRPVASLSVERRLAEPVQAEEDLLHLALQLAIALKPELERQGLGGRLFELLLFRVDGAVLRLSAGASLPLREPKRTAALFRGRFQALHDDLDAGFGIEIVRLNVLQSESFAAEQQDFSGEGNQQASLGTFIDQVTARFGSDCLLAPVDRQSHLPERASLFVPAAEVVQGLSKTPPSAGEVTACRSERPLRLFRHPEIVEATAAVPEGPPVSFRWRRTLHRVRRAEGPERLAAEWWVDEKDTFTRDYFRVEDEVGRRYWLYREGLYERETSEPLWYMQGVFA
ncbi:DNA polymerase Y family protein [Rhizobium sp. LjRoot30]|uniref:Y-family DNA polymerase n=1 Tax=Rhizobium sp. LjRoot30 TaxID=3342320 RepID=UPI003ECC1C4D